MTWNDLIKWAENFSKETGIYFSLSEHGEYFEMGNTFFFGWGAVKCSECEEEISDKNRTYTQMKAVIENLYGE